MKKSFITSRLGQMADFGTLLLKATGAFSKSVKVKRLFLFIKFDLGLHLSQNL